MANYTAKIEQVMLQLAEKEAKEAKLKDEEKAKKEEKEMREHEKVKLKEEKKEKKFAERFGKHFAESSKGIHDRMCHLEESMTKMLEMNEKYLKGKE